MELVNLLEVHALSKHYPTGFTLYPCSFSLAAGSCLGILGANGAGKSTLFGLLAGHSFPSSGAIRWRGEILRPEHYTLKRHIGYLPQELQLPPWLCGLELLRYAANLYGLAAADRHIETVLAYWDCQKFARLPLASCSHGMQKRLALALALIHNPQLLILDEPFSGLDLRHSRSLEELILRRQQAGQLTILSTHVIPYVVDLCPQVAVMRAGSFSLVPAWSAANAAEKVKLVENYFF